MSSGIYVAMGGARNQERRLETLSHDLANANTPGFKSQETIYQQIHNDVTQMGSPDQAMDMNHPVRFLPEDRLPVAMVERYTNFSQGSFKHTGNEMDVAISGAGFFVVEGENGEMFTRNGTFTLNKDGVMTTQEGFPVLGDNGRPIQVTEATGKVEIGNDGSVSVGAEPIGRLAIIEVPNPQELERIGNSNYRHPDPNFAPEQPDNIDIRQGFLETANVNPIHTMASLIKTNRIFELNTRAMQAYKAMDDQAARDVGRL